MSSISRHPLSADPHLLSLLGDELIGNDRLAIFELVKNAYDADATEVQVILDLASAEPTIIVKDNGSGMTEDVLVNSWMRLGTGAKRGNARQPSPKFRRAPLGEKGVGRLAVQKLGAHLRLVTKPERPRREFEVSVDWAKFMASATELTGLEFELHSKEDSAEFPGRSHGTLISISNLYRTEWTRRDLRALKRMLVSLKSPFESVDNFEVTLSVPDREQELIDVLDARDILDRAVWVYRFKLAADGRYEWSYEFNPPTPLARSLERRVKTSQSEDQSQLPGIKSHDVNDSVRDDRSKAHVHVTRGDLRGIGPISGELYVYDRRRESLAAGTFQQMRQYLDEQTGVRVYRDGVRVFNYGEPGDDWLLLNASRINRPVERMGTNSVIGAVHLTLEHSGSLKEKTNREGFDENGTYVRLRWIVQSIVSHLDRLRREDRERLDRAIRGEDPKAKVQKKSFDLVIDEVRLAVRSHGLESQIGSQVDYIEREFREMRDVLARSAGGLNLALVFHEIEREVIALRRAIDAGERHEVLRKRAGHVVGILDAVAALLRQSQKRKAPVRQLLERAVALNEARFRHHGILFSCPTLTGEAKDFEVKGPLNLFLAAINNLIDNSIHWTRTRKEYEAEKGHKRYAPAIYVSTYRDWYSDGNALVIADNGTGFSIETEEAARPFVSTRAGGMGLGLYYATLVMETSGGEIIIGADREEFEIPEAFDGAVVALRFKKV
jgi:signal transduction histidine kinase